MGFRNGAFASVWSVEPGKGNFSKVRLSISRKNRDGKYEQDFAGFCTFVSQAHAKAARLKEKDRIRLGDVDVSNSYDKDKKKEYVNFKVFDFDMADEANASAKAANHGQVSSNPIEGENDEGESPF